MVGAMVRRVKLTGLGSIDHHAALAHDVTKIDGLLFIAVEDVPEASLVGSVPVNILWPEEPPDQNLLLRA